MSNTLTNLLPTILVFGANALRERAVMAQLVNRDLQTAAQQKGNVVNVPIPSAITARSVTPSVTFASNVDFSPTNAPVTLDQWYEAPINLSDSDAASIDMAYIQMQSTEAIKSLANNVDAYILGKHVGFFGYAGTPGTTPFQSSLTVAASAALVLNKGLAPMEDRRGVIDPNAEFYFKQNSPVLQADQRGATTGIVDGVVGRILGFDWFMDQNVSAVTFTPGAGWTTGFTVASGTMALGATTITLINATGTGTIKMGDLFTLGGEQYVVTADTARASNTNVAIPIQPALRSAQVSGAAVTIVASAYTVNVAFHRDAWAFASRPLSGVFNAGNVFQAPTDPVSGIALRLELSRQYKQETLSYDILYGANVVRRPLACKIFG